MTMHHTPRFAFPNQHLIPLNTYPRDLQPIPASRMSILRGFMREYAERYPDSVVYDASQGDGGASLPGLAPEVLDRANAIIKDHGTAYDYPYGNDAFRALVAEQYWQIDPALGWGPGKVIAACGGRDALQRAYTAMLHLSTGRIGDVLLVTRVPWLSYTWGPYAMGANVLLAPGDADSAWTYTEDAIAESVRFCRDQGGRQIVGIVITSPDNPTGHTLTPEEQITLGHAALRHGIPYIIYDWIYHHVTEGDPMDINAVLGAFSPEDRERIIILDGITKSLGASNIRGAHLLAGREVIDFIRSRAAYGVVPHIHGQAVMMAAIEMGFREAARPIIDPTNASRHIVRRFLTEHGYRFIMGDGGYYAFIDVEKWMRAADIATSTEFSEQLTRDHGIAVVPGSAFSSEADTWVRFSYALPPDVTEGALGRLHGALKSLL